MLLLHYNILHRVYTNTVWKFRGNHNISTFHVRYESYQLKIQIHIIILIICIFQLKLNADWNDFYWNQWKKNYRIKIAYLSKSNEFPRTMLIYPIKYAHCALLPDYHQSHSYNTRHFKSLTKKNSKHSVLYSNLVYFPAEMTTKKNWNKKSIFTKLIAFKHNNRSSF